MNLFLWLLIYLFLFLRSKLTFFPTRSGVEESFLFGVLLTFSRQINATGGNVSAFIREKLFLTLISKREAFIFSFSPENKQVINDSFAEEKKKFN